MSGWNLGAGNTYASYSSHGNTYYVQSVTDHTACPGYHTGGGGYFSGAPTYFKPLAGCGWGTTGWSAGTSSSVRGAVFNPNGSTTDYVSDAHYSWN